MKRNTIMNKLHHCISATLLFTLISCTNLVQKNEDTLSHNSKSTDGKTYLVINTATIKSANGNRATIETKYDADPKDLTDLVLKGYNDPNNTEASLCVEAESLTELSEQKILIEPGDWNFTLTAKLHGIQFSGTTSAKIIEGKNNKISFELNSEVDYGKLELTVKWTNEATKVTVNLYNADTDKLITNKSTKTFTEIEETNESSASFTFDKLSGGKYKLSVLLDHDLVLNFGKVDNCIVIIKEGITIHETISLDLSPSYTINYENNGGDFDEGQTIRYSYTRKTSLSMPKISKPGYIFDGWYKTPDFTGSKIVTFFGFENTENVTFYAKWRAPEFYVSGTGDDTTGDGTETNPFETIEKACEEIIATKAEDNPQDMDWTIYIMGDVTGKHSSTRKAGERSYADKDFGRSIIPDTVTTDNAKSILITGYHQPSDPTDYPQDKINRGLLEVSSTSYGVGPALSIDTEVPVTITNVKLTNARNDMSNGNTNNESFYNQGGGLGIGANSTVYLGDGVYIEHNKAKYGGGIYNAGTLYIYGTACIGDKTITTLANGYVYTKDDNTGFKSSNEYSQGGGVYNIGKLYLGYTRYISESDNEPLEWTGGMYRSYGYTSSGGGIYITGNSTAVMNSGTIAYNDGQATGGGVTINSGTFIMTGGTICHNSTGGSGGGVKVEEEGIFYFGGGTISANWATGNGGGIFIDSNSNSKGKVFMYGDAVVGDKNKTTAPFAIISANQSDGQNATNGGGGGIYTSGYLYMGYSSYSDETDNTISPLTGGIYYNYSSTTGNNSGGGGIYINSESNGSDTAARVRMNSGTIANNTASKGGALYLSGKSSIVLSGKASIASDLTHDIYTLSYPFYIKDSLENFSSENPVYITSSCDDKKTKYYNNEPVLSLASNASISSLSDVKEKFAMVPLTATDTGIVTNWDIGDDGKVVQRNENLYVSSSEKGGSDTNEGTSSSPLATLSAAIAKMSNETADYTITVDGEIAGPQTIETPEGKEKILANSIKIIGKSNTAVLNGNEQRTTLTVNTSVPVTLSNVTVKNGKGTTRDGKIIGGGILLEEGAYISIESSSQIIENTTYDGTSTPGYGAGIYVSANAKLYLNSNSIIANNIGTGYGAGIYVAEDGFAKIIKGSGCYIKNNSFDDRYINNVPSAVVQGGGVYLENNSTFELFGGYIQDNTADQGSGIFVSPTANFKIIGQATVYLPNDVFLKNNVPVQVPDGLTLSFRARLTPETYPDDEDVYLVVKDENASATLSRDFEITPQKLTNEETQYWSIDNTGKMIKSTGMGLSISVPTSTNDIEVTVKAINGDGEVIGTLESGTHFTGETKLEFTASGDSDFDYIWYLGDEEKSTTNSLVVDPTNWKTGVVYVVYLEAIDSEGNYYSYTANIVKSN